MAINEEIAKQNLHTIARTSIKTTQLTAYGLYMLCSFLFSLRRRVQDHSFAKGGIQKEKSFMRRSDPEIKTQEFSFEDYIKKQEEAGVPPSKAQKRALRKFDKLMKEHGVSVTLTEPKDGSVEVTFQAQDESKFYHALNQYEREYNESSKTYNGFNIDREQILEELSLRQKFIDNGLMDEYVPVYCNELQLGWQVQDEDGKNAMIVHLQDDHGGSRVTLADEQGKTRNVCIPPQAKAPFRVQVRDLAQDKPQKEQVAVREREHSKTQESEERSR